MKVSREYNVKTCYQRKSDLANPASVRMEPPASHKAKSSPANALKDFPVDFVLKMNLGNQILAISTPAGTKVRASWMEKALYASA